MRKMMRTLSGFTAIAVMLISSLAIAAPRYVDAPPLSAVLANAKVNDVAPGTVQVPIITWGGDMATIYANGNQARTVRNSVFGQEQLDFNLVREDVFPRQVE